MPVGLVRTIGKFFNLYGHRGGLLIARWLVFLISHYNCIQAEITLVARHAFILYTTLSGEPWFPCQILAYLYAVSDQRGDNQYNKIDMDLESIEDVLDLFGRGCLFKVEINY